MDEWWLVPNDSVESSIQSSNETAPGVEKGDTGAMYWMEGDRWLLCHVEKSGKVFRVDIRKTLTSDQPMMLYFEAYTSFRPIGVNGNGDEPSETIPGPEPLITDPRLLEEMPEGLIREILKRLWEPSNENKQIFDTLYLSPILRPIIFNFMSSRDICEEWWFKAFKVNPPQVLIGLFEIPTMDWYEIYISTNEDLVATIKSLDTMDAIITQMQDEYNAKNKRLKIRGIDDFVIEFTRQIKAKYIASMPEGSQFKELTAPESGFRDLDNGILYTVAHAMLMARVITDPIFAEKATVISVNFTIRETRRVGASHLRIVRILPERLITPVYSLSFFSRRPQNPWQRRRYPIGVKIQMKKPKGLPEIHPLTNTIRTLQLQPYVPQGIKTSMFVSIMGVHIDESVWNVLSPLQFVLLQLVSVTVDLNDLSSRSIMAERFWLQYKKYDTNFTFIDLDFPNAFQILIAQEVKEGTVIESLNLQWFEREVKEYEELQTRLSQAGRKAKKAIHREIQEKADHLKKFMPYIVCDHVMMTADALESVVNIIEKWHKGAPIRLEIEFGDFEFVFTVKPYVTRYLVLPPVIINYENVDIIRDLIKEIRTLIKGT